MTDTELSGLERDLDTGGACDSPMARRRLIAEVRRLREAVSEAVYLIHGSEPPNIDGAAETLLSMRKTRRAALDRPEAP
jgi:hypothetical protein